MNNKDYPVNNKAPNLLQEDIDALYEKQDRDRLKEAILMSDTEKFLITTRLYKIQQMLSKAKITHKPFNKK